MVKLPLASVVMPELIGAGKGSAGMFVYTAISWRITSRRFNAICLFCSVRSVAIMDVEREMYEESRSGVNIGVGHCVIDEIP